MDPDLILPDHGLVLGQILQEFPQFGQPDPILQEFPQFGQPDPTLFLVRRGDGPGSPVDHVPAMEHPADGFATGRDVVSLAE